MEINGKRNPFVYDEESLKEMKGFISDDPWVIPICNSFPNLEWEQIQSLVEDFITQNWLMRKEEVTTKDVSDIIEAIKYTSTQE